VSGFETKNLPTQVLGLHEWIEPDGCGGFASGTISGIRTRRYHLLLAKTNSPTSRIALVNGFDAKVEIGDKSEWLTSQLYAPGLIHPRSAVNIVNFESTPWPRWSFELTNGLGIEQEIFVPRGSSLTVIAWRVVGRTNERVKLKVRLLLSGRDSELLQRENQDFTFATYAQGERFYLASYDDAPEVIAQTNARFLNDPVWYRNFLYRDEQAMGRDCIEDLASPGEFDWNLNGSDAVLALAVRGSGQTLLGEYTTEADFAHLRAAELNLRRLDYANRV
jgi:predicted glycogen debranching enzyme